MSDNKQLDEALADILPHLRDVSLRDGIQSWDGNRWRIDDILPVAKEINELARVAKDELGIEMAPAEVWGGGQVYQPALYLKEDPFRNLERLKEAMPDLELQSLYRGRQGYAFKPLSDEVQQEAIKESADRGIQVFRIFDMMNDPENVQTGIDAVKKYKPRFEREHPGKHLTIEGAVSYISEPDGKPRAWTLEEYGDYAVKLAKMGADEIVIKNYAGVGDKEMPDLVKTIHTKLAEAGFADMKVNLHSHGQKPEVFTKVLEAGADKVDVAIGELSGGPAHTNMRDMITLMLEKKGFSKEAIAEHPVMQQLARVEERIHEVVHREREFGVNGHMVTDTFDNRRGMLKELNPDDIENYHVAQGALAELNNTLKGQHDPKAMFHQILQKASELWERSGRFNTVTPGAKIIVDQAMKIYRKNKPNMTDYNDDFIKVVTGRFGRNQGMEKEGVGDVRWRDALLMYKTLDKLNELSAEGRINSSDYTMMLMQTGLGNAEPPLRPKVSIAGGKTRVTVDLKNPELEKILMATDIKRFREVAETSSLAPEIKASVIGELTPGRSPTPKDGLAEGAKVAEQMEKQGIELPSYAPLLVMLLRNGDDKTVRELFGATGHAAAMENGPELPKSATR